MAAVRWAFQFQTGSNRLAAVSPETGLCIQFNNI